MAIFTLFNEKRIEGFFDQLEAKIAKQIEYYSDHQLQTMDFETTLSELKSQINIDVPVLKKGEVEDPAITTKRVPKDQLPSGRFFSTANHIDIEVVTYNIPFEGDGELFKCGPTSYLNHAYEADVSRNRLRIELTNWGRIAGNEPALAELKAEFLRRIDFIEQNLASLKRDVEKNIPVLVGKVRAKLERKISDSKLRKDSSGKLNPFK